MIDQEVQTDDAG